MACHNAIDFLKHSALSMAPVQSLRVYLHSDDFGQPGSAGESKNLEVVTFGSLSDLELSGHFCDVESILNIIFVPKLGAFRLNLQCEDETISVPLSKPP